MKRSVKLYFVIGFMVFAVSNSLAGGSPSEKIKVPAKFQEEQEVENGNVFNKPVYKRQITVLVKEDGSGYIDVAQLVVPDRRGSDPMFFEVKRFEVEGDQLVVKEADPMPKNLNVLDIRSDDSLQTGSWDRNGWNFRTTNLKRVPL